jgi:hypothetical protein
MIKKLLLIVALFGAAYSDIINSAGTEFYITSGIPGKDSSATEDAGTQFYITSGVSGGDSVFIPPADTAKIVYIDTIRVGTDYIFSACSLFNDSGHVYFQRAVDTTSTITTTDSSIVAGNKRDTLSANTLLPSTDYFTRFTFRADTGSFLDTTNWRAFTTKDSVDSIWWADTFPNPPTITTQPQSQTKYVGQTATFTVAATGTGSLSYQWKLGGVSIGGATGRGAGERG